MPYRQPIKKSRYTKKKHSFWALHNSTIFISSTTQITYNDDDDYIFAVYNLHLTLYIALYTYFNSHCKKNILDLKISRKYRISYLCRRHYSER